MIANMTAEVWEAAVLTSSVHRGVENAPTFLIQDRRVGGGAVLGCLAYICWLTCFIIRPLFTISIQRVQRPAHCWSTPILTSIYNDFRFTHNLVYLLKVPYSTLRPKNQFKMGIWTQYLHLKLGHLSSKTLIDGRLFWRSLQTKLTTPPVS